MNLTCSVIIRCFDEEAHIGRLLSGVTCQTVSPVDIVVVDSGSTDRTVEIARQFPVKLVQIRPEEFSFGRSLNRGCREAQGDILVFASAHTYPVCRDWLERLLGGFCDPRVALVYGKQRGGERTRYAEHQVFRSWFPDLPNGNQTHAFCNNANAAVRRAVWERLPYDESLTGLEDIAWAKQALSLGYRIAYDAAAEIVHLHDERPSQIFNRYRREAIAMKSIEPAMRFSFWDFLRLSCSNVIADWRSAAAEGRLRSELLDIPLFRLLQFWGTYRGNARYGPVTEQLRMHLYYPRPPGAARERPARPAKRGLIDYTDEELMQRDP